MAEISPFLKEAQQTGNEFIAGITPVNPPPTPSYDPQANQSFGQNFYDSATMTPPANLLKYLYDNTVETQVKGYRGGGFYGKPLEAPTPSTKFDLQSYLADDPEKLGYAYLFADIHNREIAVKTIGFSALPSEICKQAVPSAISRKLSCTSWEKLEF